MWDTCCTSEAADGSQETGQMNRIVSHKYYQKICIQCCLARIVSLLCVLQEFMLSQDQDQCFGGKAFLSSLRRQTPTSTHKQSGDRKCTTKSRSSLGYSSVTGSTHVSTLLTCTSSSSPTARGASPTHRTPPTSSSATPLSIASRNVLESPAYPAPATTCGTLRLPRLFLLATGRSCY